VGFRHLPGAFRRDLHRGRRNAAVEDALGLGKGFLIGFAQDHIDGQAEADGIRPAIGRRPRPHIGNGGGHHGGVFGQHQIVIGMFGGQIPGRLGRTRGADHRQLCLAQGPRRPMPLAS
jgi:hypothetical protein